MATTGSPSEELGRVINVKRFLDQWGDQISYSSINENKDEAIAARMNVSMETVQELSEFCSPTTLWNDPEPNDKQLIFETIPDDINLASVKNQAKEIQMRHSNSTYANHVTRKMKYNYSDWYEYFKSDHKRKGKPSLDRGDNTVVTEPNVVLTVQVHRPYHSKTTARMLVSETYLVLGTNKLADLRDVIKCANDYAVSGDLSLTPDVKKFTYAKDIFKSGFFFIEGTFYNDTRHEDNRDYSEPILKWISQDNRSERIGSFKKAVMEETRFMDLDIIVGKPYYYQHQGDCEHLLIFTDLRMFHPMDPQNQSSYPFLVREFNHRRKICKTCTMNTAGWIIYKCPLIPNNPAFMCNRCFKALLYDEKGNKIGNFEAYKSSEHPT